jgi:RNase P/RNase MRP subunit POP5
VESTETFDRKKLTDVIWDAVTQLFGEYGASKIGLSIIEYRREEKMLILRCFHNSLDILRAAIAFITKIEDVPVTLHLINVSGTLKALRRNILQQN